MTPMPPSKKSRRLRLLLVLMLILIPFAVCCLLPIGFIVYVFYWPDISLHHAIAAYPGSTYLFQDFEYPDTHTGETTQFFLTSDSRDIVEKYFKTTLQTTFAKSGSNDNWLITSYQLNGVRPTPPQDSPALTHGAVCNPDAPRDSEAFKCISVVILEADQPNLCTLEVVSARDNYYLINPNVPYDKCDRLPKTGTIIIYKFNEDA